ncbi:MAG: hypothetical protein AB1597_06050 [Chloroflexota bacterium]
MTRKVSPEDRRKKNFLAKFQAAAVELNAASHRDVESLKFRDSSSFHGYRDLLTELGSLKVVEIQGNYQGRAWKLTNADDNSVIIVEHETGLEILYIVGAVASIVSLVPLVVNTWNRMRGHWPPHRGRFGPGGSERRRFDKKDQLIEEPAPPVEAIMFQHLLSQYDRLSERISSLEAEVSSLKKRIDSP